MVRVKICGNKRAGDALKAVEYGADAIGLLVGQKHASPDFIDIEQARGIVALLPPFVASVLVTHLVLPDEITPLARKIGVNTIQLHGETTPDQTAQIKKTLPYIKLYKAIHVTGDKSIVNAESYTNSVDAILLDTINVSTDQVGGTGKIHDWGISRKIVQKASLPVILAGGLNPDNVKEAIEKVKPFGVDVNSGTKGRDGYKDPKKLQAFIERAKGLA